MTGNFYLFSYGAWTYFYDADARLTSATTESGQSAQFVYDGLGRCLKRVINGETTLLSYDGWKPLAEWSGARAFLAWNMHGAGPDELLVAGPTTTAHLHYHSDLQGNVQFLPASNNGGLEKYTYDAFGRPKDHRLERERPRAERLRTRDSRSRGRSLWTSNKLETIRRAQAHRSSTARSVRDHKQSP